MINTSVYDLRRIANEWAVRVYENDRDTESPRSE